MHQERKPDEALTWAERGLQLDKEKPYESTAGYNLTKLKRALLARLGRQHVALASAWDEFQKSPSKHSYEELMHYVPQAELAVWRARALDVADRSDLGSRIGLLMETQETERLVRCIREASDDAFESLSHFVTEPVAEILAESHPELAARVFKVIGMRILNAKKSKYYHEALANFEDAKNCYARADLIHKWEAVVLEVRRAHYRKVGFMPGFEQLVAGQSPDLISIVPGSTGCREALNGQRWSLAGLRGRSVASSERRCEHRFSLTPCPSTAQGPRPAPNLMPEPLRSRLVTRSHSRHLMLLFCTYCHVILQEDCKAGTAATEIKSLTNTGLPFYSSNRCHFFL